jgi:hypothetical protein
VELSPELRQSHRELGRLSERFIEHVSRTPGGLQRSTFAALQRQVYTPLSCWPVFVGGATLEELKSSSIGVTRMVKQVPFRVFRGDLSAMAAFYQLGSPAAAAVILEEPNGIAGAVARVDLLRTRAGFQALEVNLGGIGGIQVSTAAEIYDEIPVVRTFLDEQPVRVQCTRSVEIVLDHIVTEVRENLSLPAPELNIAIITHDDFPVERHAGLLERFSRTLVTVLQQHGLTWEGKIVMGPAALLQDRGDGLWMKGLRLAAVLEWVAWPRQLAFRYWKSRQLNLYNGPAAMVLADKRNLGFLSELESSPMLAEDEREIVRRWIPWTRHIKPGYTHRHGERFQLPEYLGKHREDLVIKPARMGQGQDIHFGAVTPPDTWEKLVREALARRDWVVQERLESLPYLHQQGEEGIGPHDIVWGVFVFGSRYGGGFLRLMPQGPPQAINTALGAREALIFEEMEEP